MFLYSSLSSETSRQSCCFSIINSFSSNYADIVRMAKSLVKMEFSEPMLITTSSASSRTVTAVLQGQSPHLVNELIILACWGPTGTSVALHWYAAVFDPVVSFNLCDGHGVFAQSPLNLASIFLSPIAKLLANFDSLRVAKGTYCSLSRNPFCRKSR